MASVIEPASPHLQYVLLKLCESLQGAAPRLESRDDIWIILGVGNVHHPDTSKIGLQVFCTPQKLLGGLIIL